MTTQSNDVEARLEAMERQNRRILRQNRILTMVFLFVPCLAFVLGAANQQNEVADKIKTRNLVIENDAGKECVTIGTNKKGGYVTVHDSSGKVRLVLGVGNDKAEAPGIAVFNKDSKSLIELGISEKYGPRFNMKGDKTPMEFFSVGMAVENGVPFYQLIDENGKLIRGVGGKAIKR